ncbi:MAG: VWA domain-containing protein [Halieaceae bacterium]
MKPLPGNQASPSASSDQLLAFVQYLRGKKIPVSPADTLDAVEVAELTGYADKTLLKNGLAAALAKSKDELTLFEAAFDEYFHPNVQQPRANQAPHRTDGDSNNPLAAGEPPPDGQQAEPNLDPLEGLRGNALFDALESQDETALSVAIETAAAEAKVEEISLFTQRGQYVRKILDALGDEALREAAIEFEQSEPAAFEAVQALREQLRERVRDRVERAYLIHASAATEDLLDESLSKLKLGNVDHSQMARLKRLMDRMARKLAARHGRRRRRFRRGKLHVAETVRRAIPTDGVPFHPRWRKTERKRPQIMAICDVSGSVAAYAKFLLMFLYALQDVLPRTRSFAFSAALGEVSDLFAQLPVEQAIERVNLKYGGATDYGRALQDFSDLALAEVNSATTVIILGDARNNQADPRVDLLAEIKARAKQVIWLNPESLRLWGTGDSEMLRVKRHCHLVKECNNLKQLERIIDKLLSDRR